MRRMVVLGDVMLDKYIYGYVSRISPEAPVPIVEVEKEEYRLGGAANVANNLAHLKQNTHLIGIIGRNKEHSKILARLCEENNITYKFFQDNNRFTIVKTRVVALPYNQQLLRIDREIKEPINKEVEEDIKKYIKNLNEESILIISDYAKGSLTENLISYIKENFRGKILVDTKPKNWRWYKEVYLFKPNLKEASEILGYKIENTNKDVEKAGKKLVDLLNSNIVITRSEKGATLITKNYEIYHYPALAKEVFDVSGAGDTFIATIAYGLNKGLNLYESVALAVKASSIVVGKFGTSYITEEELMNTEL